MHVVELGIVLIDSWIFLGIAHAVRENGFHSTYVRKGIGLFWFVCDFDQKELTLNPSVPCGFCLAPLDIGKEVGEPAALQAGLSGFSAQ